MPDPYSIRFAAATDLPFVYSGELDYIQQIEPQQETRWRSGMASHLRQWTGNLERMFIARIGDDAAGYCFWQIDADVAVLASLYVVPNRRRAGLGGTLLAAFIEDAQSKGFDTLTLGVKPDNPAQRLYELSGFTFTHDEAGYRHYRYTSDDRSLIVDRR